MADNNTDPLPFLYPGQVDIPAKGEDEYRILMIGNSITRHGVSDEIFRKYGWSHVSGMAASSEEKDYAHIFAASVRQAIPEKYVTQYFYDAGNAEHFLRRYEPTVNPDLIVFQTGEHCSAAQIPQYGAEYEETLRVIREQCPNALLICIGIWSPCWHEDYAEFTTEELRENAKRIEDIQREVCHKQNIPFVSVAEYGEDPDNTGFGETAPVRWHPNDNGMKCYAEALFKEFHAQTGRG